MTYRQEQIKPYVSGETKTAEVERMFNGIAPSYDLLNHLLSFGIARRWRREAIAGLKRWVWGWSGCLAPWGRFGLTLSRSARVFETMKTSTED